MLIISTRNLTVKMRYYYSNNGQNYFQRSIPVGLRRYYQGRKVVRHKLPSVHSLMVAEIERLARHYDLHFKALKKGEGTPQQIQEQAVAILAVHGVLPGDGNRPARVPQGMYPYPHLDEIEDYLQERAQNGTMTSADRLAESLLTKPMPILLSQALLIYFENHPNGQKSGFKKGVIKRWKHIYGVTGGDIPLVDVTRDMARRYVKHRSASVKTGTVERELKTIRAVINKVIAEKSLPIKNEFERLAIANKGKDSKVREDFTHAELKALLKGCIAKGDEIRTLILTVCLTGARPSEIAGLRREDVYLNDPIPHIDIVDYASRTLKTKTSRRKVPLIPLAQAWVASQLSSHADGVLFPRYCDGVEVFGDAVSATTSKYIKSFAKNKSLYSGRHTIKTLLDQADISEYTTESIGGWGKASISRGYGTGHSLQQKQDALIKALSPIVVGTTIQA